MNKQCCDLNNINNNQTQTGQSIPLAIAHTYCWVLILY